jgi:phenylpropionate dioxygenase-like ring-hydroxylating dioxygenase large terminal subunit
MSLDDVLQPVETARGLSNAHYISPQMYARERDVLFFENWAAIAFEADALNPGDAYPVDFMGMPLLLVRASGGELKVFQNTCRHRGMILVDAPTALKGPIRCPYHSWCYDHGGKLVRTPYVGGMDCDSHEAVKPEELGLFKIRSHIWHGVVFVNISGGAPAFETAHADILERWSEFNQPYYFGGEASLFEMRIEANWKLAIENFCESYHLPWVHPELNKISPISAHYPMDAHEGYSGQGSKNYTQLTGASGQRFPDFKGLSEAWDQQAEYISFFPNVLMGVHRDHAYAAILMPQGPEATLERGALFYAQPVEAPSWLPMLEENTRIWRNVFEEDISVIEGMQRGRHGPLFDGGKFSPVMDGPTHVFHKWVARRMQAAK